MQRVGFIAWAAQALLQIIWHAWLLPPARMPIAIALLIALLPLALPLLAWRRPSRALLLAAIVSLFYFCHGVAEAWSSRPERGLAIVEVILALALIGAVGWAGRRKRTASVETQSYTGDSVGPKM
ncbi:MAG: DUF2069 domain-containing protein [Rhodanobacteraceae bacterium]